MKAPVNRHHRGSPLLFPIAGASQGAGIGLESSSHQIGAQAAQIGRQMKSFGDEAITPQSLATLVPTGNEDRLGGVAMRGLKKAAGM